MLDSICYESLLDSICFFVYPFFFSALSNQHKLALLVGFTVAESLQF
jgi:hypothetical protein